jgi:hypothetical protein
MVGATGFEPATFRSQSGRSTRLSHAPDLELLYAKSRALVGLSRQPHHVVERRVGGLAERPLGDVLADHRAVLEAVP